MKVGIEVILIDDSGVKVHGGMPRTSKVFAELKRHIQSQIKTEALRCHCLIPGCRSELISRVIEPKEVVRAICGVLNET